MNLFFYLIFGLSSLFQKSGDIPFDHIEKIFSNQNAAGIVALGKEKISISILDNDGVYSKTQGELVLNNFFKEFPVNEFAFIFKGDTKTASSFAIGTLSSKREFRVTLKFKLLGSNYKIESISIEEN